MAVVLKPKRSEVTGAPATGDLEAGELAINLYDKKIYSKKTDGTIVELAPAGASVIQFPYDDTDLGNLDAATLSSDLGSITSSASYPDGTYNNLTVNDTITQGSTSYYTKQYVLYGTTTNATETELLIGGTTRISVPTNTTLFYEVSIVARRTDATGESGSWHLKGCVDNFSGTVANVGNVYEIVVAQDDVNLAVDARADDTNNSINIYVTGVASKTIRWTAFVKTIEVAQ